MEIAETFTSQNDMLRDYLLQGNKITALEASMKFGIGSLPRRIMDLKEKGYSIEIKTVQVNKSNGKTARVSQYELIRAKKNYDLFGNEILEAENETM